MASKSPALDDFSTWPKIRLKPYLKARGLPVTGSVQELRALAFAAQVMSVPLILDPKDEDKQRCTDYKCLLTLASGVTLPDPLCDLTTAWIREDAGRHQWPPTMYCDMAAYLVERGERDLERRLMGDYKDGKAYSYFDAGFINEVLYHNISEASEICFLKSTSARSQRRNDEPHKVWIALEKKSGKIITAYCTCFAGLGSTCNHIAGVLFKLDYAWQQGVTNKACTSLPAEWTQPRGRIKGLEVKKIKDMEWRKPNWSKGGEGKSINPVTRRLYNPLPKEATPSLEELVAGLYISCKDSCVVQYALSSATQSFQPEDDVNVLEEIQVHTSAAVPPPIPTLLHENAALPTFTEDEVNALAKATSSQSTNSLWIEQRIGRITASIGRSVLIRAQRLNRGETDFSHALVDTIMGRKSVPENLPAIKYGQRMEPVARQNYVKYMHAKGHTSLSVVETGLIVMKDDVYIGASPDGLVHCDCCEPAHGLLEIKCPLSIAHSTPQTTPPAYLVMNGGQMCLRRSHPYFSQVQLQMMVKGATWCDFYVYTKFGQHCERIFEDVQHQAQLMAAAKIVFNNQIIPDIRHPKPSVIDSTATPFAQVEPMPAASSEPLTPVTVANTIETPLPAKRRRVSKQQKKQSAGPVYLCGVCNRICDDKDNIETESDNSVGCDKCQTWFHWGCIGFDEGQIDEDWFCIECINYI